ncbi:uncharacterized protein LOC116229680 isoform X2 [Phasianus colchicus]|uniref:uncharacterized protein LOC116229680 isoform X2 n=1 Tax=Phasianus colchicus TaxID=9054 RepID=UPI00129D51F3|nr:uncharacterized protein LOC116229680 isoform X2 [Phasianus colchicus]
MDAGTQTQPASVQHEDTKSSNATQQIWKNFSLKFLKPRRPGTKPRSKPSELQANKPKAQNPTPAEPQGRQRLQVSTGGTEMIGNTMISISRHQEQAEPWASRADPAAPAFPSQARGLIGPQKPLAASPQLDQPDTGEQQPLLFVFKQKMPPLAMAARGPAELNRSASLEMEIVPQCTQPAPISMQLTPQGNFVQQRSQPPALHKGKSAPVTCQPPKVRQAPVGTSVSPPCLEIISLKEGFAIKTFPRCSQSCLPADPNKARTEPLPRAAKARGVPVRSRAPRSVPLPGAKWVHKIL